MKLISKLRPIPTIMPESSKRLYLPLVSMLETIKTQRKAATARLLQENELNDCKKKDSIKWIGDIVCKGPKRCEKESFLTAKKISILKEEDFKGRLSIMGRETFNYGSGDFQLWDGRLSIMRRKTFNYETEDFQLWDGRLSIMGQKTSNYGSGDLKLWGTRPSIIIPIFCILFNPFPPSVLVWHRLEKLSILIF